MYEIKYPSYLVHFNKNHSDKNGQFISGDGDGDGQINDHKNKKKLFDKVDPNIIMGGARFINGSGMVFGGYLVSKISSNIVVKGLGYASVLVGGLEQSSGTTQIGYGIVKTIIKNLRSNSKWHKKIRFLLE